MLSKFILMILFSRSPRRAYVERLQLRAITDDLLARGIIKPSTSPYCSRIVPVKKKNRKIRMCLDLRPLNSRIVKQKYPFPNIEDCISRLYNKAVLTLFDLKNSFHQIKVHNDNTNISYSRRPKANLNTITYLSDIQRPQPNSKRESFRY